MCAVAFNACNGTCRTVLDGVGLVPDRLEEN